MRNFLKFYLINTSIAAFCAICLTLFGPEPRQQDWVADILALFLFGWFFGWFLRRAVKGLYVSSIDARNSIRDLEVTENFRRNPIDTIKDKSNKDY